uniref:Secreted protein n=1 Tax=Heliothis virescens TaxID=7102 RepID=A0A2A4JIJ6_HELVI
MMASDKMSKGTFSLLLLLQLSAQALAGTQFASHVSVNTPARSFTHGVGDPLPLLARRNSNRQSSFRNLPGYFGAVGCLLHLDSRSRRRKASAARPPARHTAEY